MPSVLAAPPPAGTPVPPAIARLAEHHPVELVWQNETGGITARIDRPSGSVYVKWSPAGSGESLADEAERMRWLAQAGSLTVPRVVAHAADAAGATLVTAAIDAASIVSAAGLRDPERAAAALGEGLRRLHALPVAGCPFPAPDWTASALDHASAIGGTGPDDRVVCHGDPCAPNTLIADGRFAGLVDLGRVGVGDRWSDLAIASWSLEWNGLAEAEPAFWRAYGIERDAVRVARWRALWDPPVDDD
ncbi:phosphotransferase [Agrococcus sp. KRD186]|uniref:phosphotransferase n=1 Tax=Agrococcus sp. KRD186 TaxID=2729730 RepID=UPI0019D02BF8